MTAKKGTSLPISGTLLPNELYNYLGEVDYARTVASALQKQFDHSHGATKTVMGWTGASERTVKNWFAGTKGPNGIHLITLAGRSDDVFAVLLRLTGRQPSMLGVDLVEARQKIQGVMAMLDEVMASRETGTNGNGAG